MDDLEVKILEDKVRRELERMGLKPGEVEAVLAYFRNLAREIAEIATRSVEDRLYEVEYSALLESGALLQTARMLKNVYHGRD